MKRIGLLIGFLAVVLMLLPLPAQDVKKDVDKTDKKKDETKKDLDKKDDAKDPEKKDEKKEPEKKKAPEKLVYGAKFVTKILGFKGETNREYTIEVQEIDPKKVLALNQWKAERSQQLAKQQFEASRQTDFNTRIAQMQQYQKDVYNFQVDAAKRSTQVYTPKQMEVRAAENAKVRVMTPPIEFDDAGFPKKWTPKEKTELRDKNPLLISQKDGRAVLAPGFPADFDAIKQGQLVEVYMTKVTPMAKKKKGPDDDDPPAMKGNEFVLMVVMQEGK